METFKIEIQEYLSRIVEVEGKNINDALKKAKEMYSNEEIILDSDDYVTTEFGMYIE